jgi:hypothetical protein
MAFAMCCHVAPAIHQQKEQNAVRGKISCSAPLLVTDSFDLGTEDTVKSGCNVWEAMALSVIKSGPEIHLLLSLPT